MRWWCGCGSSIIALVVVVDDKENDKKKKLEKFHLTFIVLSDNILVSKMYLQMT